MWPKVHWPTLLPKRKATSEKFFGGKSVFINQNSHGSEMLMSHDPFKSHDIICEFLSLPVLLHLGLLCIALRLSVCLSVCQSVCLSVCLSTQQLVIKSTLPYVVLPFIDANETFCTIRGLKCPPPKKKATQNCKGLWIKARGLGQGCTRPLGRAPGQPSPRAAGRGL